jgi:hypothetical protein
MEVLLEAVFSMVPHQGCITRLTELSVVVIRGLNLVVVKLTTVQVTKVPL